MAVLLVAGFFIHKKFIVGTSLTDIPRDTVKFFKEPWPQENVPEKTTIIEVVK